MRGEFFHDLGSDVRLLVRSATVVELEDMMLASRNVV